MCIRRLNETITLSCRIKLYRRPGGRMKKSIYSSELFEISNLQSSESRLVSRLSRRRRISSAITSVHAVCMTIANRRYLAIVCFGFLHVYFLKTYPLNLTMWPSFNSLLSFFFLALFILFFYIFMFMQVSFL